MKALDSLVILRDVCASQGGMFTLAQAQMLGVGKMDVSRLTKRGHVERVSRGVYRASAVPASREEDVYAVWLSLDPRTLAFERPLDGSGFTASLNTAAWLLGLGELRPTPIVFSHPKRRQTRDPGVKFLRRELSAADITMVAGIPTTSARRTVLDLIDAGEDLSLVGGVLMDAEAMDLGDAFVDEVNSRAAACGFSREFSLYDYLKGS